MNVYRIALLAGALIAGAAAQAEAVTPNPRVKVCHPHYEYGAPSERPRTPSEVAVYYVDALCNRTVVRVIHPSEKAVVGLKR